MREMKDSGIEWIGEIPKEWDLKRLKSVFVERKEKNEPQKTDFILSLGANYGVIPYSEKEGGGNKAKEDLTDYRLAYPNDIVMNSMNIISGSVGISKYFGCVSPVYYMLYPRNNCIDNEYFCLMFQTKAFQSSLLGLGNGIMMKESANGNFNTVRMRIPMEKLGIQLLPVPPISEQKKIADFLDKKCAEIDEVISKTEATIEEYKKLKQSVITQAVTKGIRPNREMKDSGIEWIGEIPEDWDVAKVSYFFDIQLGKMLQPNQENTTDTFENYLCAVNVGGNKLKFDTIKQMWFSENERKELIVNDGDLLVVEGGDVASCDIFKNGNGTFYFQNALHRVRSKSKYDTRILKYFLWMCKGIGHIELICNKATIAHFSKEKFIALPFVVIPNCEQEEIANYLDWKCTEIDNLISAKQKLLEELQTYKKSVIYEYVTGKKEVV